MKMELFDVQGSGADVALGLDTLYARCDFPWSRLLGGLRAQTGRSTIPVLFSDLTRWADRLALDHGHPHVHADGDTGHVLLGRHHSEGAGGRPEARAAVWGLAWYSGKIEVERTLPDWAKRETLLAEAAHMVDFFYLTPAHREEIDRVFHGGAGQGSDHGHEWFDNRDYFADVGESWMEGFVHAFSDLPDSGNWGFAHEATPAHGPPLRKVALELRGSQVFGLASSSVVHDRHRGIGEELVWPDLSAALEQGRRPCRVCKP